MYKSIQLLMACFSGFLLQAQTMVSEMGPVMYYNSLDSARGATLNRIALRAYCVLQVSDTTHTIHLKLDLDLIGPSNSLSLSNNNWGFTHLTDSGNRSDTGYHVSDDSTATQISKRLTEMPYHAPGDTSSRSLPDTAYYMLGYDNLNGNAAGFTDSALLTADKAVADLGIYIKVRDSVLSEDRILRLVDYGIQHYAILRMIRAGGQPAAPPPGLPGPPSRKPPGHPSGQQPGKPAVQTPGIQLPTLLPGQIPDREFIALIFAAKPSLRLKKLLSYCK